MPSIRHGLGPKMSFCQCALDIEDPNRSPCHMPLIRQGLARLQRGHLVDREGPARSCWMPSMIQLGPYRIILSDAFPFNQRRSFRKGPSLLSCQVSCLRQKVIQGCLVTCLFSNRWPSWTQSTLSYQMPSLREVEVCAFRSYYVE